MSEIRRTLEVALDELLAALEDARRRYRAGDLRALESTMLAATERQARKELALSTGGP